MKNNIFYTFTNKNDGNLAYHVDDKKENVDKNRFNLSKKYPFTIPNLRYMNQVHKDEVKIINKNSEFLIDSCDALITNEKNLPLMVMVADCIPVLLYDEIKGVIAAVHAGRNSTFLKITAKTAKKMIEKFNCKPENINAILGPCIQKCCYEVSEELVKIVETSFGKEFVNNRNIDLQQINKKQLNDLGIKNIKISEYCTKCSGDDYFSYRKSKKTGRFAGIIEIR
ncbi:peptidoglycan editing factor PgeF [Arcobacter sp. CECT 8985]|uniref:peptidoglycan editing factor PgeF n=1 Tax=Arcobacter sp. CECT 8985 TaxID=1935424 RepID=UPI00100BD7C1|nr:peptidoglycan editing factor PgeF [Arcobacter sp. CECT 8985]RXJ86713.1 multicopper polyphenol oxidase [Arcobacter sp. CECT 8985]